MADAVRELKWVITQHGKERLTQLLDNPTDRIRITSIHIGKSDAGDFNARESKNELLDPISYVQSNGETTKDIWITEKGIAENLENTVYFTAPITEDIGGFEIKEVALFESINDVPYMFAVGIGEPINKPSIEKGYLITVDYTVYIESANLLDVYDRIELDPAHDYIKQADVDGLFQSVLFVESNLAEQIGKNTHILGLGRAQQLNDLIDSTILSYNTTSLANYYTSLANSTKNLKDLLGFWSFNYTNIYGHSQTIRDFSGHLVNMSTNNPISNYEQEYLGILSTLNITKDDYFYIDEIKEAFTNTSLIQLGELLDHETIGTFYYVTATESTEAGWVLNGVMYPEDNVYDPSTHELIAEGVRDKFIKYYLVATGATSSNESLSIGDIKENAYAPHTWTCSKVGDAIKWVNELNDYYYDYEFKNNIVNYTGTPNNGDTISLTTDRTPAFNDSITLTGEKFNLINYKWVDKGDGSGAMVQQSIDSPFTFFAALKHNKIDEDNILIAQSDYSTLNGVHNFEIMKTSKRAIQLKMFTDANNYIIISTVDNVVPTNLYNVVITYNGEAKLPEVNIYINGKNTSLKPIEYVGTYKGMGTSNTKTTSYIARITESGDLEYGCGINSKVGLMCLVKEQLSSETIRCNCMLLNSLCGKNVYYRL